MVDRKSQKEEMYRLDRLLSPALQMRGEIIVRKNGGQGWVGWNYLVEGRDLKLLLETRAPVFLRLPSGIATAGWPLKWVLEPTLIRTLTYLNFQRYCLEILNDLNNLHFSL